jgi:hypothetical protein
MRIIRACLWRVYHEAARGLQPPSADEHRDENRPRGINHVEHLSFHGDTLIDESAA